MERPSILFHMMIKSGYEAGLIEQSLRGEAYDASFFSGTEDTLQIGEHDLDILILEPSMSQWEWLDALTKWKKDYPDCPVILYSRDIGAKDHLQALPGEKPLFVASDVTVLKDKLAGIIRDVMKKRGDEAKCVLFVDDEPNVLQSISRILRKTHWNIVTATSAEKALKILQDQTIDLVVTDVKMPQVHGVELISRIREHFKELPILVCSAYPGMKDDQELQFHDISGFLDKPINPDALKSRIKELLG